MAKNKRCPECGHSINFHNPLSGCGLLACDCKEKPK